MFFKLLSAVACASVMLRPAVAAINTISSQTTKWVMLRALTRHAKSAKMGSATKLTTMGFYWLY